MVILCYIVGAIVFLYAFIYAFMKPMLVSYPIFEKGLYYQANQNLSFLLFSIATTMIFLVPLALVKYGIWIVILLFLCITRFQKRICTPLVFYALFLLWCCYAMTYAVDIPQATNMLSKYILPILYFTLSYNAINDENDLAVFLKYTTLAGVVYAALIGGLTEKVIPPLYSFLSFGTGICITYASLADFFTGIICVPFCLYAFTQNKKYLWAAAFMMLSTVLAAVRTGIGGTTIALCFFAFIIYKLKSVAYIFLAGALAMGVVMFVPSVNEKMFGHEENNTNIELSVGGKSVAMSGREYIWEDALKHCYEGHELKGSGLGSATHFLKTNYSSLRLMHSDFVTMKCEIGDIGLGFYILFALVTLFSVLSVTSRTSSWVVKVMGAASIGSFAGIIFSMGFDNVVSYAQQALIFPFVLLGVFYRCIDLDL